MDRLGQWWDEQPLVAASAVLALAVVVAVLVVTFVLGVRQSRREGETWLSAIVDGVVEWYRLAWVALTVGRADVHLAVEDTAAVRWLTRRLDPGGGPLGKKRLPRRTR